MKRLAIFCGSHTGNNPLFAEATKQVAHLLLKNNIELVYGGGRLGLMGILANTMMEYQGMVHGVEIRFLMEEEGHTGLTKLYLTETMHERKALMFDLADAFLLLPGGAGSLDEFFEIFTWSQLGLHNKTCAILNIHNYYDSLINFIDHAANNGFVAEADRNRLQIYQSIPMIERLWNQDE